MNRSISYLIGLICLTVSTTPLYAASQTLTTYYPAPQGNYNDMTVRSKLTLESGSCTAAPGNLALANNGGILQFCDSSASYTISKFGLWGGNDAYLYPLPPSGTSINKSISIGSPNPPASGLILSVTGNERVSGNSTITGNLTVGTSGNSNTLSMTGNTTLAGAVTVSGNSTLGTNGGGTTTTIYGVTTVNGNTKVKGDLNVENAGTLYFCNNAGTCYPLQIKLDADGKAYAYAAYK